jgi:hypothetical protein
LNSRWRAVSTALHEATRFSRATVKVFLEPGSDAAKEHLMPVLDAKALDIDPAGMAFLRAVLRPDFEHEEAITRLLSRKTFQPPTADSEAHPDAASVPNTAKLARAVAPVG